jgi:hypothetical protein
MNVEIVFTGLCSVLNPRNTNDTMPEPSIILVQTRNHPGHGAENVIRNDPKDIVSPGHSHADGGPLRVQSDIVIDGGNLCDQSEVVVRSEVVIRRAGGGAQQTLTVEHSDAEQQPVLAVPAVPALPAADLDHEHVSFLAFDKTQVKVDNAAEFQPVANAPDFLFLRLDGVELTIESNPPAPPVVLDSYNDVVRKDDYWPEAKNQWDRNYVPLRGNQPKKSAVTAFMRLGRGTLGANRRSAVVAEFPKLKGGKLVGNFADEVVYADFPHTGDDVVINLKDLETRTFMRKLTFSPVSAAVPKLVLSIGNQLAGDMDDAVRRSVSRAIEHGHHFAFLNAISGLPNGPIPTPLPLPTAIPGGGGGGTGGLCGPGHGNG